MNFIIGISDRQHINNVLNILYELKYTWYEHSYVMLNGKHILLNTLYMCYSIIYQSDTQIEHKYYLECFKPKKSIIFESCQDFINYIRKEKLLKITKNENDNY